MLKQIVIGTREKKRMAKVIEEISARLLPDNKKPVPLPLLSVSFENIASSYRVSYQNQYDISVKLGYRIWMSEDATETQHAREVTRAKYAVADYIFGEFREPLNKLYMAINQSDFYKASDILHGIEKQMFYIKENDNEVN